MKRENPFYHRRAIRKREDFFGRKQELTTVFNRLRNMESVSLIGERRVGKTSFLFHLADPVTQTEYGLEPNQYLLPYVNFQAHMASNQSGFWHFILDDLVWRVGAAEAAVDRLRNQEDITPLDIARLLRDLKRGGVTLIFLFDEFDSAAENPNFDLAFFNGLRSLANSYRYNVGYVIASQRSLQDLQFEEKILGSPFFNFFTPVFLGLFTEEEAKEAITVPAEGSFSQHDVYLALRYGGRHPFFQQLACLHLFDAYQTGRTGTEKEKQDYLEARLREDVTSHFTYYWGHSGDSEKIALTMLALMERREAKGEFRAARLLDPRALRSLERRSLVSIADESYRIFSPIFTDWILDEVRYSIDEKPIAFEDWLEKAEVKSLPEQARQAASDVKGVLQKVKPDYWVALAKWLANADSIEQAKTFITGLLQYFK